MRLPNQTEAQKKSHDEYTKKHNDIFESKEYKEKIAKSVKFSDSEILSFENMNINSVKNVKIDKSEYKTCDCGCRVPAISVMNTANGTSCTDCYNKMEDHKMKNQNETETTYMHVESLKEDAQTRTEWIADYDADELIERGGITAEEAFSQDLDVIFFELLNPMLCESLIELCETLNSPACMEVDTTSLPTFGGVEPKETLGVWSWDEKNVIAQDCNGGFIVETRCLCGEADYNCRCEN